MKSEIWDYLLTKDNCTKIKTEKEIKVLIKIEAFLEVSLKIKMLDINMAVINFIIKKKMIINLLMRREIKAKLIYYIKKSKYWNKKFKIKMKHIKN